MRPCGCAPVFGVAALLPVSAGGFFAGRGGFVTTAGSDRRRRLDDERRERRGVLARPAPDEEQEQEDAAAVVPSQAKNGPGIATDANGNPALSKRRPPFLPLPPGLFGPLDPLPEPPGRIDAPPARAVVIVADGDAAAALAAGRLGLVVSRRGRRRRHRLGSGRLGRSGRRRGCLGGVGFTVGFGVGRAVGRGVGRGVGLGVGFGVGFGVGAGVGGGVGGGVGAGVGGGVGGGVGLVTFTSPGTTLLWSQVCPPPYVARKK